MAYRYIVYAEQEEDGTWRPFLQQTYADGEHEGSVRWLDPCKSTFKTKEEAMLAGWDIATYGPDANVDMKQFVEAADTDIRQGAIDIAIKAGTEPTTAYAAEKQRVDSAVSMKLAAEEELK